MANNRRSSGWRDMGDRPGLLHRATWLAYPRSFLARIVLLLLFVLPAEAPAQFTYATNIGTITIFGYTGPGGALTIPPIIKGLPVTSIGDNAFYALGSLTSVCIRSP